MLSFSLFDSGGRDLICLIMYIDKLSPSFSCQMGSLAILLQYSTSTPFIIYHLRSWCLIFILKLYS